MVKHSICLDCNDFGGYRDNGHGWDEPWCKVHNRPCGEVKWGDCWFTKELDDICKG